MKEHHTHLSYEKVDKSELTRFFKLFPELPPFEPEDELLKELGKKGGPMEDSDFGVHGDAKVRSAGITFLGQFITHDISFDVRSNLTDFTDPEEVKNYRSPSLELDCIYGKSREENPELYDDKDPDLFKLGLNDKGKPNDLPRNKDGIAVIGDERNDNTIILAQLHLAFLKFHNEVVKYVRREMNLSKEKVFETAQQIVRWHYQWMVLHYFLPQVVDLKVIEDVLKERKFYKPKGDKVAIPIEFSLAAFRFGHSIVKPNYVMNDLFGAALFLPTQMQMPMNGNGSPETHHKNVKNDGSYRSTMVKPMTHDKPSLTGLRPIKEEEVAQWRFFFWLDPTLPIQMGRKIDHKIARPLFDLPFLGNVEPHLKSLAYRSLLRGKSLGLASGERVAKKMGFKSLSKEQLSIYKLGFEETPLWYYILKEAEIQHDGERLGDVGGRIVAEVLVGLLQLDKESYLHKIPSWKPFLPSAVKGDFTMEDLLRFAGVADNKADQYYDRDTKKKNRKIKKYRRKYEKKNKKWKDYDPIVAGKWQILPYDSQIEAVHLSLLPSGKVMYASGFRVAEAINTETRLWNPKNGQITATPTPSDIFCGGHCHMPNGNILTTGGTLEYRNLPPVPPWLVRTIRPLSPLIVRLFGKTQKPITFAGPTYNHVFNYKTEQWEFAGDMIGGRWYPTNTLLPSGKVMILSGTDEAGGIGHSHVYAAVNRRIELYDAKEGLSYVGNIPDFTDHSKGHVHGHQEGMHDHDHGGIKIDERQNDTTFPSVYPRMFVLPVSEEEKKKYPEGRAFCAGYGPETKMLDLKTWEWEDVDLLPDGVRWDGCAVLLPLRPPHYKARVLHCCGTQIKHLEAPATATAEIIDFSEKEPKWKVIKKSHNTRVNGVGLLLPTGKIMLVGGNSTGKFDDPVWACETYDPETGEWELIAEQVIPRGYHSTALLLQDGRVLSSGTTPYGKHELGMELYYPEYLFKGPRPVITEVTGEIEHNKEFIVRYEFPWRIDKVILMSPGSVTHAFDMNIRYVECEFKDNNNYTLTVKAPRDGHVAPPGYYMLLLLSENDVPSEGTFLRFK